MTEQFDGLDTRSVNDVKSFMEENQTPMSMQQIAQGQTPTLTAVVDGKKQPLRRIRPFEAACLYLPITLHPAARAVLENLFRCFEKQKHVSEGLIGDVIWGFEQSGIDRKMTMVGLLELWKAEYIKFQAKDNTYIRPDSEHVTSCFIRYQPKLLEMVYER